MNKTSISKRRWLLMPIETKARELTAKTLLACTAAERGWGTVIGGYRGIIRKDQERLPRGTFIEKSVSPTRRNDCIRLKDFGNRVSAWCEEGLLYVNAEAYRERRIDRECFDTLDYFFAWGKQQAEDISPVLVGAEGKIVLSGNPRFDLLRPEMRAIFAQSAQELRKRYGKIILINTKFSAVNINKTTNDFDYVSYLRSIGKIKTDEQEAFWRRYIRLNKEVFPCFQKLLPLLSKEFSEHTIIVRPHPAEKHAPWVEKAKDLLNVQVLFEGSVNEWLLAADVMIHNNCTTGVEAFLLERPVISYRPFKDEVAEDKLPNEVSFQVECEEELLTVIRRFTGGKTVSREERRQQERFARQYIANLDGKLACDTIMDTIDRLDLPLNEGVFPLDHEKLSLKSRLIEQVKQTKKRIRQIKTGKANLYTKQKFPGLTLYEVEKIIHEFRMATGRFLDLEAVPVGDDTFCIYRP